MRPNDNSDPLATNSVASPALLSQLRSMIRWPSPSAAATVRLAGSNRRGFDSLITHLQLHGCICAGINLSQLVKSLPHLTVLECHAVRLHRSQTNGFAAPHLTVIVMDNCTMEGVAVGHMMTGSPLLTDLSITGNVGLIGWAVWVIGKPTTQLPPHSRHLCLNLVTGRDAYHVQTWSYASYRRLPVRRLRIRLAASNLHAFRALVSRCHQSVEALDLVIEDNIWPFRNRRVLHLNLHLFSQLRHVRFMIHIPLLEDLVANIRELVEHQHIHNILLLVIVTSHDACLTPLASLEDWYTADMFPSLDMLALMLLAESSDELDGMEAAYTPVVNRIFENLQADDKLEFSTALLEDEAPGVLKPYNSNFRITSSQPEPFPEPITAHSRAHLSARTCDDVRRNYLYTARHADAYIQLA
ncbi:hypothetical protein BDZ89DRAFT_1045309 [Hymenopellis radicata]|nr:hypothetical protein BDZ89DRAFT_1045309 [Hymenopellis radicata]